MQAVDIKRVNCSVDLYYNTDCDDMKNSSQEMIHLLNEYSVRLAKSADFPTKSEAKPADTGST